MRYLLLRGVCRAGLVAPAVGCVQPGYRTGERHQRCNWLHSGCPVGPAGAGNRTGGAVQPPRCIALLPARALLARAREAGSLVVVDCRRCQRPTEAVLERRSHTNQRITSRQGRAGDPTRRRL